ncbi:hypothetical protein LTS18_012691, partial [Coniosporium uncinatum]
MHSALLFGLLATTASAFPGMGRSGLRRAVAELPDSVPEKRATATSSAAASASSYPAWKAPQPGEVRSPCPGLNALANHNICPRSGKGYTIPILTKCLAQGMNMGADFSLFVGTAGIGSNPNPASLYFDLDMLDRHDFVI